MAKRPNAEVKIEAEGDSFLLVFGSRVREARKKAGLTQAQLGTAAGLTQSYIFEVEKKGANLTLKAMAAIAHACKVSLKDLIPDNDFESVTPVSVLALISELAEALLAHQKAFADVKVQLKGYTDLTRQLKSLASPTT
jgi:XRE family aerobic/anaerobic benzoate catabolism transcriptional regulator